MKRIGQRVAALVDDAALGICDWQSVADAIVDEFPGSSSAIVNQNMVEGQLNFTVTSKFDPDFVDSYNRHYVFINPWLRAWAGAHSGAVMISEAMMPVSRIEGSEFYNDWLRPHGDVDASVGLKIRASPRDTALAFVHYPLGNSSRYDRPISEMLKLTRGAFARFVGLAEAQQLILAETSARSSLVGRDGDVAFVVDASARLKEANAAAAALFRLETPFRHRRDRISFSPRTEADFDAVVRSVLFSAAAPTQRLLIREAETSWLLTGYRLPAAPGAAGMLLGSVPLALFTVRNLGESRRFLTNDLAPFAEMFDLTPAEARLCISLAEGLSLAEASIRHGLSNETVRSRVKNIFAKTHTGKQTELLLLLARYTRL